MLPSSGLFQDIICPFYENGACDRPYCHFRHAKKDPASKVIKENEKTVEKTDNVATSESGAVNKVTYNPTPIAELQKIQNPSESDVDGKAIPRRHIPVPYTPLRPMTVSRPVNTEVNKAIYLPGSKQDVIHDQYKPPGYSPSKESYLPGTVKETESYTPANNVNSLNLNYVPTDKKDEGTKKSKRLEYKPKPINKKKENSVKYEPTPLTVICPRFSSDEEEEDVISKKQRLSPDLNDDFDNLDNDFEMLGQILNEENHSLTKIETAHIEPSKESLAKNENGKSSGDKHSYSKSRHKDKKSSKETKERSSREKDSKHDKDKNSKHDKDKQDKHRESKDRDKRRHKSSKSDRHSSSSRHSDNSKTDKHKENRDHKDHKDQKKDRKESSNDKHDKKNDKLNIKNDKHNRKKDKEVNDEIPAETLDLMDAEELVEDISEDDEDTIALECKKIFEEYIPTRISNVKQDRAVEPQQKTEEASVAYIPTKKRVSHSNVTMTAPKMVAKKDYKAKAAITLAERIAKVRQQQAIANLANLQPSITSSQPNMILSQPNIPTGKVRIAHVPYASSLLNAKKEIVSKSNAEPSTSFTVVQSVPKGSTRKAHIPNEVFADRPGVLEPLASKISVNLRSLYLNKMIDECIKIYLEPTDAYARAQHEELTTSKKCNTNQIYKNSAMLAISRLRKELQESNGIRKTASECSTLNKVSHNEVLLGKLGMSAAWSIERRNKLENVTHEFIGATFYNNIAKWILNEEQLRENGFPRLHPNGERGRAHIYVIDKRKQQPPEGNKRICRRCNKTYLVAKTGFPIVLEDCIHHPNNKYKTRGEVRYQCCKLDSSSDGCTIAPTHVFEYVDYENLRGFVKTMPKDCPDGDFGVYALDCEMCYTTHGLDLTKITVINPRCKIEYETLIKPIYPIIDYNTRYSGITAEQMVDVTTTLVEVQATLLHMFNDKTILIGHSLESDFKALKIIHDTVIDTSVLFPHKMGPPYKRALRNLTSEFLSKIIQNSEDGHDSAEDATVCMELIIFKLKEELKLR